MPPSSTAAGDNGPPYRKSVLFCANCGHASHVNGDWILHERSGSRSVWYQCPECSRPVSVRPSHSLEESWFPSPIAADSARGTYGTPPDAVSNRELWADFWDTYREVASAWLSPWRESFAKAD